MPFWHMHVRLIVFSKPINPSEVESIARTAAGGFNVPELTPSDYRAPCFFTRSHPRVLGARSWDERQPTKTFFSRQTNRAAPTDGLHSTSTRSRSHIPCQALQFSLLCVISTRGLPPTATCRLPRSTTQPPSPLPDQYGVEVEWPSQIPSFFSCAM